MDTKYLNTFLTIVTEGSFSKAAEKLNYTQSTITFQIGQLEKEFSVQLFEKIGRNMVLTKAGQQLVPYVDSVLEAVDKLYYSSDDVASCCGDLHIGVVIEKGFLIMTIFRRRIRQHQHKGTIIAPVMFL